mgnify:CR=1 FL=1
MNPQELMSGLRKANQDLDRKNEELAELSEKYADAERAYRIALAGKILEHKAAGHPVTIINDLARGDKAVADLRFQRDVAKEVLKSGRQAAQGIVEKIGSYRSLLTFLREEIFNSK